jgi:hypothetical protein
VERGQVALFFMQWIFILVQGVVVLKTLYIFDHHLKPIRMKNILSFIAQAVAVFAVTLAYLFTLQYFGL